MSPLSLSSPLCGENMTARSANIDDGARVDIRAKGFWNGSQDAFFHVRVFYSNASTNCSNDLLPVYTSYLYFICLGNWPIGLYLTNRRVMKHEGKACNTASEPRQ